MTSLAIVILMYLLVYSDAKKSFEDERLIYRKNVVDFKLAWCQIRMRRYDWKNMIGRCLKHVPWDATSLDEKLQTRASISYVERMDIKPAGFFSKIYIQSVRWKTEIKQLEVTLGALTSVGRQIQLLPCMTKTMACTRPPF